MRLQKVDLSERQGSADFQEREGQSGSAMDPIDLVANTTPGLFCHVDIRALAYQ